MVPNAEKVSKRALLSIALSRFCRKSPHHQYEKARLRYQSETLKLDLQHPYLIQKDTISLPAIIRTQKPLTLICSILA
jgi:hypothetical protein